MIMYISKYSFFSLFIFINAEEIKNPYFHIASSDGGNCRAVAVGEKHLLTSASCVVEPIVVYADNDKYSVRYVKKHPEFKLFHDGNKTVDNDVAVIGLNQSVNGSCMIMDIEDEEEDLNPDLCETAYWYPKNKELRVLSLKNLKFEKCNLTRNIIQQYLSIKTDDVCKKFIVSYGKYQENLREFLNNSLPLICEGKLFGFLFDTKKRNTTDEFYWSRIGRYRRWIKNIIQNMTEEEEKISSKTKIGEGIDRVSTKKLLDTVGFLIRNTSNIKISTENISQRNIKTNTTNFNDTTVSNLKISSPENVTMPKISTANIEVSPSKIFHLQEMMTENIPNNKIIPLNNFQEKTIKINQEITENDTLQFNISSFKTDQEQGNKELNTNNTYETIPQTDLQDKDKKLSKELLNSSELIKKIMPKRDFKAPNLKIPKDYSKDVVFGRPNIPENIIVISLPKDENFTVNKTKYLTAEKTQTSNESKPKVFIPKDFSENILYSGLNFVENLPREEPKNITEPETKIIFNDFFETTTVKNEEILIILDPIKFGVTDKVMEEIVQGNKSNSLNIFMEKINFDKLKRRKVQHIGINKEAQFDSQFQPESFGSLDDYLARWPKIGKPYVYSETTEPGNEIINIDYANKEQINQNPRPYLANFWLPEERRNFRPTIGVEDVFKYKSDKNYKAPQLRWTIIPPGVWTFPSITDWVVKLWPQLTEQPPPSAAAGFPGYPGGSPYPVGPSGSAPIPTHKPPNYGGYNFPPGYHVPNYGSPPAPPAYRPLPEETDPCGYCKGSSMKSIKLFILLSKVILFFEYF